MTAEKAALKTGPVEGAGRVLRELLRTPRFKESVRILLRDLDPENGALLARTLMFEDPEFFLSLLSAVPALVNTAIAGLEEALFRAGAFPPEVLDQLIRALVEDIDTRGLGRVAGQALALLVKLPAAPGTGPSGTSRTAPGGAGPETSGPPPAGDGASGEVVPLPDVLVSAMESIASQLGARAAEEGSGTKSLVEGLARGLRAVARGNPEFMREVAAPLVAAGREALARAEAGGSADGEDEP